MSHKVFVYGTLKKGYGNHRLLSRAKFLGPATTEGRYTMYSTGGFPAVVKEGNTAIVGEMYEITDEELARLDMLEGYPTMYDREQIALQGNEETPWMYIWQYHTNLPVVEEGLWE